METAYHVVGTTMLSVSHKISFNRHKKLSDKQFCAFTNEGSGAQVEWFG